MKVKPQLILLTISAFLVVTNIFLLWQNLALKAVIAGASAPLIKEGDVLSDLKALNLDEGQMKINFQDNSNKKILFFFRTNCKFCQKQMKLWKSLNSQVDHAKYTIIAVTAEKESAGIREFIKEYGIEDWEVLKIRPEDALDAKFGVTPITAVVDQTGRIEKSWAGQWSVDQIQKVNEYFAVDLYDS